MIEVPTNLVLTILGCIGLIMAHIVLTWLILTAPKGERLLTVIVIGILLTFIWTLSLTILKVIVWVN